MNHRQTISSWLIAATFFFLPLASQGETEPSHHFAKKDGVKIHFVSAGDHNPGTPVIMIHGFPDYWYTWRKQIAALSKTRHVVAIDMRGFNKSDKPKGVDHYAMSILVEDVAAVLKQIGKKKAIICGHEWGGMVAWTFAMTRPGLIEKLIVLNLPHPHGLTRELATNPQQQKNPAYAREFQKPGAHKKLTAEGLASWVTDVAAKKNFVQQDAADLVTRSMASWLDR